MRRSKQRLEIAHPKINAEHEKGCVKLMYLRCKGCSTAKWNNGGFILTVPAVLPKIM